MAAVAESSNLAAAVTEGDGCSLPDVAGVAHASPAKVRLRQVEEIKAKRDLQQSGKPLSELLDGDQELLQETREQFLKNPEWQGIDPDKTPVFYRPKAEVDKIRSKAGESGGHHPHGLALGGPEGQVLTPTGETRTYKNPLHTAATSLQRRIINIIRE